jgi:single-stranded DNA-binding protein
MYLNKVLIKGRMGAIPERRFLPSGELVCNFSVATKRGKHIQWHKLVCYKNDAEVVLKLTPGDFVFIEAFLHTRELLSEEERKKGTKPKKLLEIIVESLHVVEKNHPTSQDSEEVNTESREQPENSVKPSSPRLPRFI